MTNVFDSVGELIADREAREEFERKHPRCIGCRRFIRKDVDWNQCPNCDTRTHEDY